MSDDLHAEIARLRAVIDTYVLVCESAAKEIRALREAAGLPVDGRTDDEAAPESPDWERPPYRTLGPSTWMSE